MKAGCWLWKGSTDKRGYGQIRMGKQLFYAHRVMAALKLDLHATSKLEVLHRCDNPACFNPEHLFLGTQRDNMRDMLKKGRQKKISARILERAKRAIQLHDTGLSYAEIARRLACGRSHVWHLIHNYNGKNLRELIYGQTSDRGSAAPKSA